MITPGFTFLSRKPPYKKEHLYIIISILGNNTKALFVNITTEKEDYDTSCILRVGDHEFITHDSVINYADATITEIVNLEEAIKENAIRPHKPTTSDLLNRILIGAANSKALPQGYLKYIP